jgi:large subunit ribosomal protein L25
MDSGQLATAVFEIEVDGKRERAIVKDIQYHVATYAIEHIDLMILGDKKVRVNVPIQLAGVSDCAGVKLGGFLRQVVRAMRVECPAGEIPQAFTLDVKELQVSQSRRLADIAIPQGVRPLVPLNEVAVVVAKPKGA